MKRMIALVLACLMAAAFAACASQQSAGNTALKKKTGSPAAPSPTPAGASKDQNVIAKITTGPLEKIDSLASVDPNKESELECLRWDTFVSGGRSDLSAVNYEIFTDHPSFAAKYGEMLGAAAEAYKPFGRESVFIVAVTCSVSTGGYTFGLNKACVRDGVVYIDISRQSPSPNTAVTQAFVNHTVLVAFESSLYKEGMPCEITVNGQRTVVSTGDRS